MTRIKSESIYLIRMSGAQIKAVKKAIKLATPGQTVDEFSKRELLILDALNKSFQFAEEKFV